MKYIDLRSDTVTQPTQEMREAMLTARVGDDVYGDDPTVNKLEELAAQKTGKEAALFVPSGTMGNQIAIMTHTRRGDEIIVGENCHIVAHEVGAAAVLSSVCFRILAPKDDIIRAADVEQAIRSDDIHAPRTGLVCIENALATGGVVPLDVQAAVYQTAHAHGIPVHMDGARLFNAATALGVPAAEIAANADSVMFCLSKGLCAPVGSMLVGSKEFIDRARKNRKLLGGGMRQAGFLAAAGIIALEKMTDRLAEDHANARYMAQKLAKIPGVSVDASRLDINMVFFTVDRPLEQQQRLPAKMLELGVKINGPDEGWMRFVTSHDVNRADIDLALANFAQVLGE